MSAVSFDLQPGWLRRHEVEPVGWREPFTAGFLPPPGARSFGLSIGGEAFVMTVQHLPAEASHTRPAEASRPPTDAEVLIAISRAFLGSLPVYPLPEPDLGKGWEAYRRELAESGAWSAVAWDQLNPVTREAFALGVRAAMEGAGGMSNDEGRMTTEEAQDHPSGLKSALPEEVPV